MVAATNHSNWNVRGDPFVGYPNITIRKVSSLRIQTKEMVGEAMNSHWCMGHVGHTKWSDVHEAQSVPPFKVSHRPLNAEEGLASRIVLSPSQSCVATDETLDVVRIFIHELLVPLQLPLTDRITCYFHVEEGEDVLSFSFVCDPVRSADAHAVASTGSACSADLRLLPSFVDVNARRLAIFHETVRWKQRLAHDAGGVLSDVRLSPLLVVGAGGIGCELLKCLVLDGFRKITVIDLDTIDATNLNRQFLFEKGDIDRAKTVVAVEAMRRRLRRIDDGDDSCATDELRAMVGNVKDAKLDVDFYRQFRVVLNGLDNTSARKHVNRMCMAAGVPLLESGTMGYNGQVQPIVRGVTECYDCRPKPSDQKTFAVCTIHARPTQMVHCVHFAKELYGKLFGEEPSTSLVGVSVEGSGENNHGSASELDFALEALDMARRSSTKGEMRVAARTLFRLLFVEKIQRLLDMKDAATWSGSPPVALTELAAEQENCDAEALSDGAAACIRGHMLRVGAPTPTTRQCRDLLEHTFTLLVRRLTDRGAAVAFQKDDDDAVNFVACVANLRAACFHIELKPLEDLRGIAGSIVAAIATSNAIIAAALCSQARRLLSLLSRGPVCAGDLRLVFLRKAALLRHGARREKGARRGPPEQLLLHTAPVDPPNSDCLVCAKSTRVVMCELNVAAHTVGSLVNLVLRKHFSLASPCLGTEEGTVLFEEEEFVSLQKEPLQKYLRYDEGTEGGPASCFPLLVVSDWNQDVEWKLKVLHNGDIERGGGFLIDGVAVGVERREVATE